MDLLVNIKLLNNPVAGDRFGFVVYADGVVVDTVNAVFGSGGITVGATAAATANNVALWLSANHPAQGGWGIAALDNALVKGVYSGSDVLYFSNVYGQYGRVSVHVLEDFLAGFAPFVVRNFSLEIIDTYENERFLIEEFSQKDSLKLEWDGGDDIFQPVRASRLSFNMYVPDGADAHFLHLLTGDERRYMVRLKNIDPEGSITLLWQGFILPDTYSEPWKLGLLFVGFTATDMIGSLKGKYFKNWQHQNSMTLPEIIASALSFTGLQQMIYVSPVLVSAQVSGWLWRYVRYSLVNFGTDSDKKDVYTILESVLTAQGLQITSFRGKWVIEGITRRNEGTVYFECYFPDGSFAENINVPINTVTPRWGKSPNLTAETPLGRVVMDVSASGRESVFTDDVVSKEIYLTRCNLQANEYSAADFQNGYSSSKNLYWQNNGFAYLVIGDDPYLIFRRGNYNYSTVISEATALNNNIKCGQSVSVVGGRKYVLTYDLEFQAALDQGTDANAVIAKFNNGDYDKYIYFVLKIGGVEFLSNRPGNQTVKMTRSDAEYITGGIKGMFKIDYTFIAPVTGALEFFILPMVGSFQSNSKDAIAYSLRPKVLKVVLNEKLENVESVRAVRNIGYTKEISVNQEITCTADSGVSNSFNYGAPVGSKELPVSYTNVGAAVDFQSYSAENPLVPGQMQEYDLLIALQGFDVPQFIYEIVFGTNAQQCLYLIKESGDEFVYDAIFVKTVNNARRFVGYRGYTTPTPQYNFKPKIPIDFDVMPVIAEADKLVLRKGLHNSVNPALLEDWVIYGFPEGTKQTYMKTLAYAYHCVRPDISFRLEGTAFGFVFPLQRVSFIYNGENRFFNPTRLTLDLFNAKTVAVAMESKLNQLSDVTYE